VKPLLVDGFEAQRESQQNLIERLVASGATHVFIASDRANIAQIANEAANKNLTIAGPETLRASDLDVPLPVGVLMAARNSELNASATAKIIAARQTQFATAEGYAADAYIAAEIAMAMKANPALRAFNTASGDMTIATDGFIEPVNFTLFRFDGTGFQQVTP
jgi:branched-chain amino acid transport system substrate-binding protein